MIKVINIGDIYVGKSCIISQVGQIVFINKSTNSLLASSWKLYEDNPILGDRKSKTQNKKTFFIAKLLDKKSYTLE